MIKDEDAFLACSIILLEASSTCSYKVSVLYVAMTMYSKIAAVMATCSNSLKHVELSSLHVGGIRNDPRVCQTPATQFAPHFMCFAVSLTPAQYLHFFLSARNHPDSETLMSK